MKRLGVLGILFVAFVLSGWSLADDRKASVPLVHTLLLPKGSAVDEAVLVDLSTALQSFWADSTRAGAPLPTPNQMLSQDGRFEGRLVLFGERVAIFVEGPNQLSAYSLLVDDPHRLPPEFSELLESYPLRLNFDLRTPGLNQTLLAIDEITREVRVASAPQGQTEQVISQMKSEAAAAAQEQAALMRQWKEKDVQTLTEVLELGAKAVDAWEEAEQRLANDPQKHEKLEKLMTENRLSFFNETLGDAEVSKVGNEYIVRVRHTASGEVFVFHRGSLDFSNPAVKKLVASFKIKSERPEGGFGRDVTFIHLRDLRSPSQNEVFNVQNINRFERSKAFVSLQWWRDYWWTVKDIRSSAERLNDVKFGTFCGLTQAVTTVCAAGIKKWWDPSSQFRWDAVGLSGAWGGTIGSFAEMYKNWTNMGSHASRTGKSLANGLAFAYSLFAIDGFVNGNIGKLHAMFNFSDNFWGALMLNAAVIAPSVAHNYAKTHWYNFGVLRERLGITVRDPQEAQLRDTWKWKLLYPRLERTENGVKLGVGWTKPFFDTGFRNNLVDNQIRFYLPSFFLRLLDWFFHTPLSWISIPVVELGAKQYVRWMAETTGNLKAVELGKRLQREWDKKMLTIFGVDEKTARLKLQKLRLEVELLTGRAQELLNGKWVSNELTVVSRNAKMDAIQKLENQIRERGGADSKIMTLRIRRGYAKLVGDTVTADELGQELNKLAPKVFSYQTTQQKVERAFRKFELPNSSGGSSKGSASPNLPSKQDCSSNLVTILGTYPAVP